MKPKWFFRSHRAFTASINYGAPVFLGFAIFISGLGEAPAAIYGGASSGTPSNPQPGSAPVGGTTPTASDAARANALEAMARTNQAVGAAKALQDAARAAAANANNAGANPNNPSQNLPNVPNGIGQGGLLPATGATAGGTLWQGAELPTEAIANGLSNVTIRQTAQQALLTWQTFNVGKDTTLTFDQSAAGSNAAQWIAFNKIVDPTANPTQILGQIKAQGQVYIINPNGIIFGGASQVNVHTLTASALPINDNLVAKGLLNNPDQQFLFNGLNYSGKLGDVTVQAGAKISTPVSADGNGGRIALIGANVTNSGTLSSPAGQTVLAAGLQVGMVAHASSDPSLRGLDIFVGAVTDPASALAPYAGTVTNNGIIEIMRASTVLTGKSVNQLGIIDGSTSVSLNGRIDLNANYGAIANTKYNVDGTQGSAFLYQSTGAVTLGTGSITRILPERNSTETAIGTELALRSQINLQGLTVHFDEGSEILAPNAKVSVQAGKWVTLTNSPYSSFIAQGGQVYLDAGASINLAGTVDATASVAQNYLTLILRGSELSVAPLQRDGELRGDEITVDITKTGTYNGRDWIGTPLADVSGFVALIQRDVSQLTTAGGTLDISAGGSVVIQKGSVIDVSGGWTNFTGDTVATTQLISNGRLIDIADATPDQIYTGIYTGTATVVDPKWGITQVFSQGLALTGSHFEAGYAQGADAGGISLTAPAMAIDGKLLGTTLVGPKQGRSTTTSTNLPAPAALALKFQAQLLSNNAILTWYPGKPDVTFGENAAQEAADPFATDANGNPIPLKSSRSNSVYLSAELFSTDGFGRITIENNEGNIFLPEDVTLARQIGGSITLKAANISILGDIIAPGGTLDFTAYNISPYQANLYSSTSPLPPIPSAAAGKGIITIGANATLNTAGLITDDRRATSTTPAPLRLNGGSVSLSGYDVDLQSGAVIDVSGGYILTAAGKGTFGNAGAISVKAGQDVNLKEVLGGSLTNHATLLGYSGAKGGSLSLQAGNVQIGGSTTNAATLMLQPDFFNQGGFGTFNISGLGGNGAPAVLVAAGTEVAPVVKSFRADQLTEEGSIKLVVAEEAEGVRRAVSLNLSAPGVTHENALLVRGDVIVDAGALIRTDAGGSVSITGNTVSILGSIITPGGTISIAGGTSTGTVFNDLTQALATTYIASTATLSAAGKTVLVPDAYGRRIGTVFNGGTISIGGNIAAAAGAVLDVSGTSGVLDLDPTNSPIVPLPRTGSINTFQSSLTYDAQTVPTRIDSDGGSITLKGGQMLFSDATLLANAGGASAAGGTLTVSSGRFDPPGTDPSQSAINLIVKQQGPVITTGSAGIGAALGNGGHFSVDRFTSGGFDSLSLGGVVSFDGNIDVHARGSLRVGADGFIYANSNVNLTASYVAIGKAFLLPTLPADVRSSFGNVPFTPTFGSGNLTVTADQIDIGDLSLQNIGSATLKAINGDIRGSGTLQIAGDLNLTAGQIYPVTATNLSFIAYDHGTTAGSITVTASGTRSLPLSAGGTLGIYASNIHQNGTLRAPFGTINLGWDGTGTAPIDLIAGNSKPFPITTQLTLGSGSVTSVSAIDLLTGKGVVIPYGVSTDGENWIDPRGADITTGGAPQKAIVLSGKNVTTESGSSVDLRGGGDLFAYRWVSGIGGLTDILASQTSFAIVPGYGSDFAPVSAYNNSAGDTNLIKDNGPGYTSTTLKAGDRIFVAGSKTLAEGYYTLLPARYALLPGAVLVTPSASTGLGTVEMPDQSSVVAGFRFNSLNDERTLPSVLTRFELASGDVIHQRAEYENYLANTFLKNAALAANATVPRLPTDSGQLIFQATQTMSLFGGVSSQSITGGRGSIIDISTPLDTYITSNGAAVPAGSIALDAATLNSFGAESLLIGGTRSTGANGTTVTVRSGNVTVDNSGSPLVTQDLILVANNRITIADNAEILATGSLDDTDTLLLNGNGALVRVSSDADASIVRSGVTTSTSPVLSVGQNAILSGNGLILDSSATFTLNPSAILDAKSFSLSSGRISLILDNAGTLLPDSGLQLTNSALTELSNASSLSLTSYSSIDVYGTGTLGNPGLAKLALSAGQIRGLNSGGGSARITAGELLLQNSSNVAVTGTTPLSTGSIEFNAGIIHLGANQLAVNGYANTLLTASKGIIGEGSGGLTAAGSLTANTPVLTAAAGAKQNITAAGALNLTSTGTGAQVTGGLGAAITLTGTSVDLGTKVLLPSGAITVRATTGDVTVNGTLNAAGTSQVFHDVTKSTSAGTIKLSADLGNVLLNNGSLVDLSAPAGGGNAGSLGISVPKGSFTSNGSIRGQGGAGGTNGSFELDTAALPALSALSNTLNSAALTESQKFRVRTGDVLIDGLAKASDFSLSADQGSITVTGTIDASGNNGGSITLSANGSVTTADGSRLTVAALDFNNAGKGGIISLEAGSQFNGVVGNGAVDIRSGSTLDLSVASKIAGDALTAGSSAYQGEFSGTLHLRAPQVAGDLRVNALNGSIIGASSIVVEGYKLYDLTSSGGAITGAVQTTINNDGIAFLGAAGSTTAGYTNMTNRLLANNSGLASVLVLAPGAEIINRSGNLTLGTTTSTTSSDWNLSTFRYGQKSAAGVLTLRAAGDIVFYNALSDGFAPTLASTDPNWLWTARLSAYNAALPANAQSWSYRLSAGADLAASDFSETLALDQLAANTGSLKLGNPSTVSPATSTEAAIANHFQVIRTGSGDIDINAARNVQLLNQFATIYTAGTRVSDFTMGGVFGNPSLSLVGMSSTLGTAQQSYSVQYSMAGGNVTINAGQNIERLILSGGNLVADSQFQMPSNWLYRRSLVDATGRFGVIALGSVNTPQPASTTWWVDFSNFFQGVGALGGGNVSMIAGGNISNVDAVVPTNARMPGYTDATQTVRALPDASKLLELGGGDLLVKSGNDIDAGVYYVERGNGTLNAGGSIHTNSTRSVLAQSNITAGQSTTYTELPTTLFVGKGGFEVSANGDVLLGPVSNPFLLPGGLLNSFRNKTYFSTYGADSYVDIQSLGGDVTIRNSATLPGETVADASSLLQKWYENKLLYNPLPALSASNQKPWLRLNEDSLAGFPTLFTLEPGSLTATAFSGDLNIVGNITLTPSATGRLELLAAGSFSALQPNGVVTVEGVRTTTWGSSTINLSDADPASVPGITKPFSFPSFTSGDLNFLESVNRLFRESGATAGNSTVLQVKQALHTAGLLHLNDSSPTRIYAGDGDISGLTLFSPKAARILAGRDITDIAFYIQNVRSTDVSVVSTGGDLTPYNSSSPLRIASRTKGNGVNNSSGPRAGDIQIGGPGTLQVLAGGDLDLGTGVNNADGTGTGITSIGNTRNPYLAFDGANLVIGAGMGVTSSLLGSGLHFDDFIEDYVATEQGAKYLEEISPGLNFNALTAEEQARVALQVFYLVLRDAGRNYPDEGNYDSATAAIETLFGKDYVPAGNLLTRGRDLRTNNGGDISIIAPGGGLALASTTIGNPLSPPGIITAGGGNISVFTKDDINIGIGRIFTLRGGNEILWSSEGDIAAGSSSKTIKSAPPTRVLIDPQSAAVQTDLAGLATGGGIGVLATVSGVTPGNVDLIAPNGTVDAGDAGIRSAGNLNIAANQVLNAGNISTGGTATGTPAPVAVSANIGSVSTASNAAAAATSAAQQNTPQQAPKEEIKPEETLSIISAEVIGYGGGSDTDEEEEKRKKKQLEQQNPQ